MQVAHAINKEKKGTIVANLTNKLNGATLCYGLSYEKCTVRRPARWQLPVQHAACRLPLAAVPISQA